MNAFEFKSQLNIGKFRKVDSDSPSMADYSLDINGETYYFSNNTHLGETGYTKWCLVSADGSECYCFSYSRKQVLEDLLTSMYLEYKMNS